jgi:hypothetical protein
VSRYYVVRSTVKAGVSCPCCGHTAREHTAVRLAITFMPCLTVLPDGSTCSCDYYNDEYEDV